MIRNFIFKNVIFLKHEQGESLVVKGQVTNKTGRNYHAVVFRFILLVKSIPKSHATFTINGFDNGQTRTFKEQLGELKYDDVVNDITGYEIYPETGY